MGKQKKVLEIEGLTKSYGSLKALDNVNLFIPKGKVTGLVGPNGAGKTTLIKCINGFLGYSGDIKVMDFSDSKLNKNEIGYLGEDEGYYTDWTGWEYLYYFAKLFNVKEKEKTIKNKLNKVGLLDRKDDFIDGYSNGMKKRLGIARTLLHDPNLLIFDEPLSGLDPLIKNELTGLINTIAQDDKSVLISSHQLKDIEEICNWVILIKKGQIKDFGDPKSISKTRDSLKTLVFDIPDEASKIIEDIENIDSVVEHEVKETTLIVKGKNEKRFEKDIFKWLLDNDIDFSLKHGSLDGLYEEVFK